MKGIRKLLFLSFIFTASLASASSQEPLFRKSPLDVLVDPFGKIITPPVLTAKVEGDGCTNNSTVKLFLTLRSTSDYIISIFDANPERSFDISIKDAKGYTLPLTGEGRSRKYPGIIMHRETLDIEPEKEMKFNEVDLCHSFEFNKGENYTVSVTRDYFLKPVSKWTAWQNKRPVSSGLAEFRIKR